MSRSGYSDECAYLALWSAAVDRATFGSRGQRLLHRLREALDAMPHKRLIIGSIQDTNGDVCALGALDPKAPNYEAQELAHYFGIAHALAAEIVYQNDEYHCTATPEQRWSRMRAWVTEQIISDEPSS